MKIFTVYDSAVQAYLQPFFMKHAGEAVRGFTDLVNDGKSMFAMHPQDYTLFEVGIWDEINAKITCHATPISLGVAVQYKNALPAVVTPVV